MSYGVKMLRKVLFGKETTAGTAVTPTAIWRGVGGMLEDQRTVETPGAEELVGFIGGTDRTYIPKYAGQLELEETELLFEQGQYLFASAFGGPSTAGAANGTARVYQTNIPTTAVPTPIPGASGGTAQTYTIETGDNIEVERGTYGLVTKISLSGVGGEAVKVSATMMTRATDWLGTVFSASPAIPTVEEVLAGSGSVYIDAIGGGYGTTLFSNKVLGFSMDIEIKWTPKYTIDNGRLDYSYAVYTGHEITGEMTYEQTGSVSGTTAGQYAAFRNQTPQLLTLRFNGGTINGAGTLITGFGWLGTVTKTCFAIGLPFKYTEVSSLDDQDGNSTRAFSFASRYNGTAGNAGTIFFVNRDGSLV